MTRNDQSDGFNPAHFEKKLAAYAVVGAAALAAPGPAHAAIILTSGVNTTVTQPGSFAFNLGGASSADITVSAEFDPYTGAFSNVDASSVATAGILQDASLGTPSAAALAFGALIDPTSASSFGSFGKMTSSFKPLAGDWSTTGGSSYLGFYFTSGTGVHAGWADIATTDGVSTSFEVLSYAYETVAGQTITAGKTSDGAAVPEPPSMALLALGGAGLLALRRRRQMRA